MPSLRKKNGIRHRRDAARFTPEARSAVHGLCFLLASATLGATACSSSEAPADAPLPLADAGGGGPTDPEGPPPLGEGGTGAPDASIDARADAPTSSGDAGTGDAGITTVDAVKVDTDDVCDLRASTAGVFLSTRFELRAIQSTATGATRLLGTLPTTANAGCPTLAIAGSTLYAARTVGQTGEIYSVSVAGGTPVLAATIPSRAPTVPSGYPLTVDATHLYVAGNPNIWRLPLVGGALERFSVGANNYYPSALVSDASALYTFVSSSGGDSIVRIDKAAGTTSAKSVNGTGFFALVLAGSTVYTAGSRSQSAIQAVDTSMQTAARTIASFGAYSLASDGTRLYAARMQCASSSCSSDFIETFSLQSGQHEKTIKARGATPFAHDLDYSFTRPLDVDGSFVYAFDRSDSVWLIPK